MASSAANDLDLAAVHRVLLDERFAGILLVEPLRSRLLQLVSSLVAKGKLDRQTFARFVRPLLEGVAPDRSAFRLELESLAWALSNSGETCPQPGNAKGKESPRRLRFGWRTLLAAALLTFGLAAAGYFLVPRGGEAPTPSTPAVQAEQAGGATSGLAGESPAPSPAELQALVEAAAGSAPTALEAAAASSDLSWLPGAVQRQKWSPRVPMPLHNGQFVNQLLQIGPASRTGTGNAAVRATAQRIVATAEAAPAAQLWRRIDEAGQADRSDRSLRNDVDALVVTVFARNAANAWRTQELAQLTREKTRGWRGIGQAGDALIARAWALGAFDLRQSLNLADPPWLRGGPADSYEIRNANGLIAAALLLLGLIVLSRRLYRSRLAFDQRAASSAQPRLPLARPLDPMKGLDPSWMARWRAILTTPVRSEPTLDLEASVVASAARAGITTLRYRRRRSVPEIIVAVARHNRRDALAHWWIRFFTALNRTGTFARIMPVRRSLTGSAAREVSGASAMATYTLTVGEGRHAAAPSSGLAGDEFSISAFGTGRRQGPGAETDIARVGAALEDFASERGDAEVAVSLLFDPARNWQDESRIGEGDWARLKGALILQLEPAGFRWLAGCALFPLIDEALAWSVADALKLQGSDSRIRNLSHRLFATPWLRAGWFPRWLRERLSTELLEQDAMRLGRLLTEQFRAPAGPGDSDAAIHVAGGGTSDVTADTVVARFVFDNHLRGLVRAADLPADVRKWILPNLKDRVLQRSSLLILAALAAVSAAALMLLQTTIYVDDRNWKWLIATAFQVLLWLLVLGALATMLRTALADLTWVGLMKDAVRARTARLVTEVHRRLLLMLVIFALSFGGIGLRLMVVSILRPPDAQAPSAILAPIDVTITDRNGLVLAGVEYPWEIAVHPNRLIGDPQLLARRLAQILPERSEAQYRAILTSRRNFYYLKRGATDDEVMRVNALGEPAIEFSRSKKRFYPQQGLAASYLGTVDFEGNPQSGLQNMLGSPEVPLVPRLATSLDARVQRALEAELSASVRAHRAFGGAGVVLDAVSGELIAIASVPTFNLNNRQEYVDEAMFNRAIVGVYEYGLAIAPLTIAAGLESRLIRLEDRFGPFDFGPALTAADDNPNVRGSLTIPDMLASGSRRRLITFGNQVGENRQRELFEALGLTSRPRVDWPVPSRPIFPETWDLAAAERLAFGDGIALSPLQAATAYAPLVNGGEVRPVSVLRLTSGSEPPGTRALSPSTSLALRKLMRLNVLKGSARNADASGFRVGGFAGTAPKYIGQRPSGNVVSSFIGAFPMDSPRYVIVILIDDPKGSSESRGLTNGAWTAAPSAARVINRVAPLLGISPSSKDLALGGLAIGAAAVP